MLTLPYSKCYFLKNILFIYLAVPNKILVVTHGIFSVCSSSLAPGEGPNLGSLGWECGVLATAPPGKSSGSVIKRAVLHVQ